MFDIPYKVDLARGVQKTIIRQVLATEDNLAHTINVACTRNGAAEDLTGATVGGYFIRADDATISLDGSVSGNTASVVLNSSCYQVEGRCYIAIKVTKNDEISTIFLGEGTVSLSRTETIVVPSEKALSLEELFARLYAAEEAVSGAVEGAEAAQASIEASKETVDAATAAITDAQNAADRANEAAATVEGLDVAKLAAQVSALQAATTPTVLWAADEDKDWSSGNITVPGISEWYLVDVQTSLGHGIGINTGTNINAGFVSRYGTTDSQQTVSVSIGVDGDTLTLNAATRIRHKPDDTHGAIGNTAIKSIIGLMKKGIVAIQE